MKRVAVVCWIASAALARADATADRDAARHLFEAGRSLKEAGKLDEACDAFERSYQLERAAGTALNLAECRERAGDWEFALELYEGAEKVFAKSHRDESAKFAREHADALRAAHPPKPATPEPAPPVTERAEPGSPSGRTIAKVTAIGGLSIATVSLVALLVGYRRIQEFEDTTIMFSDPPRPVVTTDDCGEVQLFPADVQGKFEAACAATRRARVLEPVMFISAGLGIGAALYLVFTKPAHNTKIVPSVSSDGAGVAATFEW